MATDRLMHRPGDPLDPAAIGIAAHTALERCSTCPRRAYADLAGVARPAPDIRAAAIRARRRG